MKISLNVENKNNNKDITFGYRWSKDEHGFRTFETNYVFDPKRQRCNLKIYKLDKDFHNNYKIAGLAKTKNGAESISIKPDSNKINMLEEYGITSDMPFAYHYVVEDLYTHQPTIEIDAGDSILEQDFNNKKIPYNIVIPHLSNISKGGSMKLVNIDTQNVGVVYKKDGSYTTDTNLKNRGLDAVKTLTNVFGGTAAGLEKDIDEGKYDGYSRIISLPVFTREDFTSHKYWIEDIFQTCNSLMNINNYASLQKKMFAHNLNFVSDGAFVNEGLQGVHFSNVLKWGESSPYFRWFRADNLKNAPLSLGVFPRNTQYISHRLVNSPRIYYQSDSGKILSKRNHKYDSSKPTYIQFFDKRLVTEEEKNNPQYLIKTYSKLNTENVYDIHTHDDSVFPYAFEINPESYQRNVDHFNELGLKNIKLDGYEAARILSKNENFVVDGKFESGFETWDANPDIAKLNFVMSNNDIKNLKNMTHEEAIKEEALLRRAHVQVQDYTIEGGKYWTQKTNDILRLHIAQNLQNIDPQNPQIVYNDIIKKSDNKLFPKLLKTEISKEEVENVLEDMYFFDKKFSQEDKNSQILEQIMNFPLESIEFGTNLVGVLASPMVTKRASVEEEIGVPRYELYKKGNPNLPKEYFKTYNEMENIYKNQMHDFVSGILNQIDKDLPENTKIFEGNEVTEYGKYVLPLIVPQITKYAVVKAFVPKAEVNVNDKTGEISYDYNQLLNTHIESLNIPKAGSVENETMLVLGKLKNGILKISGKDKEQITDSILKSLKGTSVESFKLADLIIDKTQAGLDWRIDATKDIADIDSLKTHKQPFEDIWNDVIGFWSKFTQAVLKENPNSYIVAEVTDVDDLHKDTYGTYSSKYPNKRDILQKFIRETGITATANYDQYFYNIVKLFSKSFQDGSTLNGEENTYDLANKFQNMLMSEDEKAMLKSFSLPAIIYSYSFIGNHDKPRALHCAALDMDIFYIKDFNNASNIQKRQAFQLLTDTWDEKSFDYQKFVNYNFSATSPKAVAMGLLLRKSLVDALNKLREDKIIKEENYDKNYQALSKAVADLSGGKFKNIKFDADSFGVKPIDFNISKVIEQAKYKHHLDLSDDAIKKLEDTTFEIALKPATTKILAMMKVLVALPGMPTLYDGDDKGATGYDSETKNMYLQGRQRVHNEWVDESSPRWKKFIADFDYAMNEVMKLRGKPECEALNNGSPFVLPMQTGEYDGVNHNIPAILQKSPDGKMTISLFNFHRWTHGQRFNYDNQFNYTHKKLYLKELKLNYIEKDKYDGTLGVGIQGIKPGTEFVNANNKDDVYEVKESEGYYYLKNKNGHGIVMDDTTLVLYSVDKKAPVSFTGQYHIKQNINTIKNTYLAKDYNIGQKLSLNSN